MYDAISSIVSKKGGGAGSGNVQMNTEALRNLRFHILAFFHTNSDAMCLPREREKCFHVNYVHVQSWKVNYMSQWLRQSAFSVCTNELLPSSPISLPKPTNFED